MKMKKTRLLFIVFIYIIIVMFLFSCKNTVYSFKAFSYPPTSKPHEDNWEYSGRIIVTSREKGSFSKKSDKSLHIVIKDKNKRIHLSDKFKFNCGSIDTSIKWDQFEKLEIIIYEIGNKFAKDDYNKQLLKMGPILLVHLKYTYDHLLQEFKRVESL